MTQPDPHGTTWETQGATVVWDDEGWADWGCTVVCAGGTVASRKLGSNATEDVSDLATKSIEQDGNKPAVPGGSGGGGKAENVILLHQNEPVPAGTPVDTIIVRAQY